MDFTKLPSILTPDLGLLFWMLLAFLVVFFVLAKYGFPAITNMVEERKKYIDESLKKEDVIIEIGQSLLWFCDELWVFEDERYDGVAVGEFGQHIFGGAVLLGGGAWRLVRASAWKSRIP